MYPKIRKGTKKYFRVVKWLALLRVCEHASFVWCDNCVGHELGQQIKYRLIRDYGFRMCPYTGELYVPTKLSSGYNSELRSLTVGWNKYLERLEETK